jgi:hypothetical protein
MRSRAMQSALTAFLEAAAAHLQAELAAGAEVPFELEQRGAWRRGSGPSLYCYRPLTGDFISERMPALEGLPGYAKAVELLARFEGLGRYLVSTGHEVPAARGRASAGAAIANLLREVFAEQSDFELAPERLHTALARLENAAVAATNELTVVGTLAGLTITSPELALTRGLTIAQPTALEGLPADAYAGPAERLVVVLSVEDDEPREALARAREILDELLRALRLFGDGRVTFGTQAWARIGDGEWTPLALGAGGRPRGMLVVTAEQEDELRAFCNLVSRRAPEGDEIAWALRRFEFGCERQDPHEALSDHLLALRALLEPEGPASGLLAGRLAALCATPERRLQLTERILQAIALERAAIAGTDRRHAGSEALVADTADHLRALLRDVICGHLDPDLVSLADEILLEASELEALEEGEAQAPAPEELVAEAADEPQPPSEDDSERVPTRKRGRAARAVRAQQLSEEIFGNSGESGEVLDVFI